MKKVQITFERDVYDGPACLEYSWVPEGHRRNILLQPGQPSMTRTDSVNLDLPDEPSSVQVYVLTNNRLFSIDGWQFPPTATGSAIVSARVSVHQQQMLVNGYATFEDGTDSLHEKRLEERERQCPTGK